MRRALGASLAALFLLAACRAAPSGLGVGNTASQSAVLTYNVTREYGAIVLRGASGNRTVEAKLNITYVITVLPLPNDRFALLSDKTLAVIDAGAKATSIALEDCFDAAAVDHEIRVLCPSTTGAAGRYVLKRFDDQLKPLGTLDLVRIPERSGGESLGEDSPKLLAVGPDAIWVSYPSVSGSARGGTHLVVKHDLEGRILGSVRIDGVIYSLALSPDGRYLAMTAGGSGGACATGSNLRVLELGTMNLLNTEPDTPRVVLAKAEAGSDYYFTADDLRWTDAITVTTRGTTADHGSTECGADLRYWERTFSVGRLGVDDRELLAKPDSSGKVAFLGPDCADVITSQDGYSSWVATQGGRSEPLPAQSAVLYMAPLPEGCRQ